MAFIPRKAKKHLSTLWEELLKFWFRSTPKHILKKGEFWGKGQLEIISSQSASRTESWRGQIKSCEIESTEQGMEVAVHFCWCAKRVATRKTTNFFLMTTIEWSEWVELRHPFTHTFTIAKFSQNKDLKWKGVQYPKRLSFVTPTGDTGVFYRRNDPHNLRWQKGGLYDPVSKKRFVCKPITS